MCDNYIIMICDGRSVQQVHYNIIIKTCAVEALYNNKKYNNITVFRLTNIGSAPWRPPNGCRSSLRGLET